MFLLNIYSIVHDVHITNIIVIMSQNIYYLELIVMVELSSKSSHRKIGKWLGFMWSLSKFFDAICIIKLLEWFEDFKKG